MVWGILAAVSFLFAAAKYITHRIHNADMDKLFLKIHLVAGTLLPTAAVIHTVKMLKLKPGFGVIVSGMLANAGILGLMVSHFFSKPLGEKALPMHRFSTVFGGASIAAHCARLIRK